MLYAEDLEAGMEFPFGDWPVTEADIIAFAKVYDPQPMHIDSEAAAAGVWGGIIASGLQTLSIYQALLVEALWNSVVGKAGRTVTATLRRPVRPGMTLSGGAAITGLTLRPERGDAVIELRSVLVDADGAVVCEVEADAILFMRPPGA
ncbi:MAG TPA: MaoC/PaaZ C-terminal domain-containing protein [Sporichthya sp.]|nr:MaoC/PaaZ C-terminal domain-containing protein [Sporichthya sp.]